MYRPTRPGTAFFFALALTGCAGKTNSTGTHGPSNGGSGNATGDTDGGIFDAGNGGTGAKDARPDVGPPPPLELLEITGIAYGGGHFVAVGEHDVGEEFSAVVYTSTNGDSWELTNTLPGKTFRHVAFGNGVFLASTVEFPVPGTIQYALHRSTDGKTFTDVTAVPPGPAAGSEFAFGNGVFALSDGTSNVLTSADGVTFDTHSAPASNPSSIAFGAGHFTYVDNAQNQLWVSADAVRWDPRAVVGQTKDDVGMARGFDAALAVRLYFTCCFGEDPASNRYARASSLDGTTWKVVDGNHTPVPMPEFVTEDGCITLEPTTFDTPKGPDTPCASLKNDPAVSGLEIVQARAHAGTTYVLGGGSGIVTSHGGTAWARTLKL